MFEQSLDHFIVSEQFAESVISSTRAGRKGEWYSAELFEEGSFRVLASNMIGNRYETPGMIVVIPSINDEEYEDMKAVAGSDDPAALARELRGSDILQDIAQIMRAHLSDREMAR